MDRKPIPQLNAFIISYKHIFDDYDQLNIKDLLTQLPSKKIIQLITAQMAYAYKKQNDQKVQYSSFLFYVEKLPPECKSKIEKYFEGIKQTPGFGVFTFLNNYAHLILMDSVFQNYNDLETNDVEDDLTDQEYIVYFKLYLWASQKISDQQQISNALYQEYSIENHCNWIITTQLPSYEFIGVQDFSIQFIKALYFFEFCETNDIFKGYLNIFLDHYKLDSWKEYLMILFVMYRGVLEADNTPCILDIENERPMLINFLENLLINPSKYKASNDFLSIRNKPFYQSDDKSVILLNINFIVDKIYQGIQFSFAQLLVQYKATFNNNIIKLPADFLSIYGTEFSETDLFYKVIEYAFKKSNYVLKNGKQLNLIMKKGEPDFYIRDKQKIYLFEFKNIYINGETKHSYDFEKISSEVSKKLVKNDDHPKGVTQLVNVIEKIGNDEFEVIDNFNKNDIVIYPIIVYVDSSFDLPGFNYYMNKEFRKQLTEKSTSFSKNIQDLVLINFDTLIQLQELFLTKSLKLNYCLNEYYKHVLKTEALNKISSFSMFIKQIQIRFEKASHVKHFIERLTEFHKNFRNKN
ncbi:hypothetical protein BH10BAC2_BH10BAC2_23080 [soil metagenome]